MKQMECGDGRYDRRSNRTPSNKKKTPHKSTYKGSFQVIWSWCHPKLNLKALVYQFFFSFFFFLYTQYYFLRSPRPTTYFPRRCTPPRSDFHTHYGCRAADYIEVVQHAPFHRELICSLLTDCLQRRNAHRFRSSVYSSQQPFKCG